MRIHVRPEGAELLDANSFSSFDVLAPELDVQQVVELLSGQPSDEPRHLYVPIERVRRLAGDVDQSWSDGFAAMIEFARSHGWMNDADTHIKAHIIDQ